MKHVKTIIMALLIMAVSFAAQSRDLITGVVNINTASQAELMLVPGIGPAKAEQIMSLRKDHAFERKEDLLAVKGVGQKILDKIAPYVVTQGESTIQKSKAAE